MRTWTSALRFQISAVCLAMTAGMCAQQKQIVGSARSLPEAPSMVRSTVATKTVSKPSPWRALSETDHLTNREVFDKKFLSVHGTFLASIVYDAELTHQGLAHHRCVEGNINLGEHPSRGDVYRNNLLEQFVPITVMDWFLGKYVWKGIGYEGATIGSVIHFRGGTKWLTSGCW
jgi:hypothetical protein